MWSQVAWRIESRSLLSKYLVYLCPHQRFADPGTHWETGANSCSWYEVRLLPTLFSLMKHFHRWNNGMSRSGWAQISKRALWAEMVRLLWWTAKIILTFRTASLLLFLLQRRMHKLERGQQHFPVKDKSKYFRLLWAIQSLSQLLNSATIYF